MTDGKKAMAAKAKKIAARRKAYRDLMDMRDCFHVCSGYTDQEILDKSLMELATNGEPVFWRDIDRVDQQNRIVRLMIAAGANPNAKRKADGMSLFEMFISFMDWGNRYFRPHCALEIAKTDGFKPPKDLDFVFLRLQHLLTDYIEADKGHLTWHLIKDPRTMVYSRHARRDWEVKEEFLLRKKLCRYGQALVYTLFEKGIKPKDKKLLKSLQPVYAAEKKSLANASRSTSNTHTGGRSGVSR